jgi:transcriptional regulator with XRE-family HTH domain
MVPSEPAPDHDKPKSGRLVQLGEGILWALRDLNGVIGALRSFLAEHVPASRQPRRASRIIRPGPLAERVRLAREARNMTLSELERLSGVPQQAIGKYERGIIRRSKFEPQLLAALGLRGDGSFGDAERASAPTIPEPTETGRRPDTADGSLAADEVRVFPDGEAVDEKVPVSVAEGIEAEPHPPGAMLEELRRRAFAVAPERSQPPSQGKRGDYQRSPIVRRYVLARANGKCEGCGAPAPFARADGTPYLEPHHLRCLSDEGLDHPAHVIGICPNCHRRVHFGVDGEAYNAKLMASMATIEPYANDQPTPRSSAFPEQRGDEGDIR